jgi:hypothetical protein
MYTSSLFSKCEVIRTASPLATEPPLHDSVDKTEGGKDSNGDKTVSKEVVAGDASALRGASTDSRSITDQSAEDASTKTRRLTRKRKPTISESDSSSGEPAPKISSLESAPVGKSVDTAKAGAVSDQPPKLQREGRRVERQEEDRAGKKEEDKSSKKEEGRGSRSSSREEGGSRSRDREEGSGSKDREEGRRSKDREEGSRSKDIEEGSRSKDREDAGKVKEDGKPSKEEDKGGGGGLSHKEEEKESGKGERKHPKDSRVLVATPEEVGQKMAAAGGRKRYYTYVPENKLSDCKHAAPLCLFY